MGTKRTVTLIKHDLSKLARPCFTKFLLYLISNASFKITFWFRICSYFVNTKNYKINPLFWLSYCLFKHYEYLTGIQVNIHAQIMGGVRFAHFSTIVINEKASIGENVTIFQGVTIGSMRGKGAPTIGNNVVIAAGAAIIGKVKVGNNCFIGANAVVVKDVPDGAVVVGNPAKIINFNGAHNVSLYNKTFA